MTAPRSTPASGAALWRAVDCITCPTRSFTRRSPTCRLAAIRAHPRWPSAYSDRRGVGRIAGPEGAAHIREVRRVRGRVGVQYDEVGDLPLQHAAAHLAFVPARGG